MAPPLSCFCAADLNATGATSRSTWRFRFGVERRCELIERHGAELASIAGPNGHRAGLSIFWPNNEHIRMAHQPRRANLRSELFRREVTFDPKAARDKTLQ